MPQFSGNLNFLYAGMPLPKALALAGRDGFKAVEIANPYTEEPETLAAELRDRGMAADLINSPAGNTGNGEKGLLILSDRDDDFSQSVAEMKRYAVELGAKKINLLAGLVPPDIPEKRLWDQLIPRARYAASELAPQGVTVLFEHMNRRDVPGYFFDTPAKALRAVEEVALDNCRLQYDIYHAARSAGDLTQFMRDHMPLIGHIQIADTPGRHQPGRGELNYRFIFEEIDRLGYIGRVGLEYNPVPDVAESLAWLGQMGYSLD